MMPLQIISDVQIKTMRHHFIPFRMAVVKKNNGKIASIGEEVKKLEPLCTAGR